MNNSKDTVRVRELETLGVLATCFLIIGITAHYPMFLYLSLALMIIALFIKPLAGLISEWWLRFAGLLGIVFSNLILTLVFYLFLTPLAFLYRFFNADQLMLKPDKEVDSLYTERNHTYSGADLEKMW